MRRILIAIAAVPIGAAVVSGILVLFMHFTPPSAGVLVSLCLGALAVSICAGAYVASGFQIRKSIRENRAQVRHQRGLCIKCGYDLRGTRRAGITTCPECGSCVGADPPIAGAVEIAAFEHILGGKLPMPLRLAYLNGALQRLPLPMTFTLGDAKHTVSTFHPPDAKSNDSRRIFADLPENAFVFACDDLGNDYFILADGNEVYLVARGGNEKPHPIGPFENLWQKIIRR